MSHPNDQELAGFVYGDMELAREAAIEEHVQICEACRERVASWRGVRQELGAWRLSESAHRRASWRGAWSFSKRAVAAVVLIGVGFGIARAVSGTADSSRLSAEVDQRVGIAMTTFATEQVAAEQRLRKSLMETVSRLEARQAADHDALRRDVETVALRTQEEFERMERAGAGAASSPVNP